MVPNFQFGSYQIVGEPQILIFSSLNILEKLKESEFGQQKKLKMSVVSFSKLELTMHKVNVVWTTKSVIL